MQNKHIMYEPNYFLHAKNFNHGDIFFTTTCGDSSRKTLNVSMLCSPLKKLTPAHGASSHHKGAQ